MNNTQCLKLKNKPEKKYEPWKVHLKLKLSKIDIYTFMPAKKSATIIRVNTFN